MSETQEMKYQKKEENERTVVKVGDTSIGGGNFVIIAGPCAVENDAQIQTIARAVNKFGADMLRGGAFKPRTSPYSFQGLGEKGLKLLVTAREITGLPIVTEAMDFEQMNLVEEYADVIQIGARNMQNFALLKAVGKARKPVLLKRGLSATVDEWLNAAEYILAGGNDQVILCERGIRTFGDHSRNTLDLHAVIVAKQRTHLPVIVDPSHAAGEGSQVIPLSKAAVAVGADGIMVEVHNDPANALSDGAQSLTICQFKDLCKEVNLMTERLSSNDPIFKEAVAVNN